MRCEEFCMILESISLLMDVMIAMYFVKHSDNKLSKSRANYGSGVLVGRT